jgi:DNA-binding MarR family transcriptional regulator
MAKIAQVEGSDGGADHDRIVLSLLETVERNSAQSQRDLASELGVALGLVNAYLKRCVSKGLLKVQEAPARRYAYYLTPHGFAEKSRLTASYFAHSFSFFRRARASCESVLDEVVSRNFQNVALAGVSDLTEIMILCASDYPITLVGVVDPKAKRKTCFKLPVFESFSDVQNADAVLVTEIVSPDTIYDMAVASVGGARVFVPALIKLRPVEGAAPRAVAGRGR